MAAQPGKAKARRPPRPRSRVQRVHFRLRDHSARKVCVAGTFNNWQAQAGEMVRAGDGTWMRELRLKPGIYEYRLVVDGKWIPDPQADHSVVNGLGERNSLLTVR